MTTIHYAITTPTPQHQPDGEEGRRICAQTIEEAINAAMRVCSAVQEKTTTDFIATADRYLVDIHLNGECQGCEPISFGWTRDFDPPYQLGDEGVLQDQHRKGSPEGPPAGGPCHRGVATPGPSGLG